MWSRSYPGTPRYVISRRFERTPNLCALIWEMGVGAPLAPYPMAPCSRSPLRSRSDVEIPGVRRGGDGWWCRRHKGAWAPMGAGAGVGRAGVVCGVVIVVTQSMPSRSSRSRPHSYPYRSRIRSMTCSRLSSGPVLPVTSARRLLLASHVLDARRPRHCVRCAFSASSFASLRRFLALATSPRHS